MKNSINSEEELAAMRLAFLSSKRRTALDCIVLIVSGMAMTLAFPGINFDFIAWIAILPLIALCASRTPHRAFWYGMIWGYAWNLTCCFFLREIMFFIPFIFAVILGLFTAVWASMLPVFFRCILYPRDVRAAGSIAMHEYTNYKPWNELLCVFALSAWWVCMEWVRSWIATGFPWNLLAATQWRNINFIQVCEFTGIYGVSFLIIFINLALYFAIFGLRHSLAKGRYKRPYPFLLGAVLCILNAWLGNKTYEWRKAEYHSDNQKLFTAGVVQTHLTQRRFARPGETLEALDMCTELSRKLLAEDRILRTGGVAEIAAISGVEPGGGSPTASLETARELSPLQLVVWPESAVPIPYYSYHPDAVLYRENVRKMMHDSGVPFLIGTLTFEAGATPEDLKLFNSAILLKDFPPDDTNPKFDLAESYSKVHIVPFGEYVPFHERFPQLGKWIGMGRSLTPGTWFTPLNVAPGIRAGTLICYEDVFPYTARNLANNGANVLLVITNDAWYPTSFEPQQHYANSIFRAIETRLPMIRCGNSDYSVVIDPRGRIIDSVFQIIDPATGEFKPDPGRRGAGAAKFVVRVPKKHEATFYMRHGDVFVLGCWIVFLLGLLRVIAAKFDFRRMLSKPFEAEQQKIRDEFRNTEKREGDFL